MLILDQPPFRQLPGLKMLILDQPPFGLLTSRRFAPRAPAAQRASDCSFCVIRSRHSGSSLTSRRFALKAPAAIRGPRMLILDHSEFGQLPHFQEIRPESPCSPPRPEMASEFYFFTIWSRHSGSCLFLDHSDALFRQVPHFQEIRPESPCSSPRPAKASEC